MNARRSAGIIALVIYVTSVVLANTLTAHYGLVGVGFGLLATAGTFAIGGAVMVRDLLQDALGRGMVLVAIILGAVLSYVLATPTLAVASGVTFLIAELFEMTVYTPLRRRVGFGTGRWAGVVGVANATGIVLDTFIFLKLAGFPISLAVVEGQLLGKVYVTLAVVGVALAARRARATRRVFA